MNLLRSHFQLFPEKSDDLEPELNDHDKAKRSTLMILFNFGCNDTERCLDQSWEVFQTKHSGVGLESLVVLEVLRLVVYHPRRLLILFLSPGLTKQRKRWNLRSRLRRRVVLGKLARHRWRNWQRSSDWSGRRRSSILRTLE
jgi:hypothetical protein